MLLSAGEELLPGLAAVNDLLTGGKRLRPAFCYWGWLGAGGEDCPQIMTAAASLELLHASALIHDDVMDASDTRRGQPSLHRQFETRHTRNRWRGSAPAFGTGAAILMGDLLMCWTDEMFHASGLPPPALLRGREVIDVMRTEVIAGQYLDLLGQATGDATVETALRVVEFKTAKYTIERPLHLGAALAAAAAGTPGMVAGAPGPVGGPPGGAGGPQGAGGPPQGAVAAAYSAYGLPLGVAFQLRDDILGVFGDPAQTGKPAGDDVREGKRTVLLAMAQSRATPAQAALIERRLGDPDLDDTGTAQIREIITGTGALAECESLIESKVAQSIGALSEAPITSQAKAALAELAVLATSRHD